MSQAIQHKRVCIPDVQGCAEYEIQYPVHSTRHSELSQEDSEGWFSLSRVNPKCKRVCRVCTLVPGRRHQEVVITVDPEGRSTCVPWFPGSITKWLRSLWTQKEVPSVYPGTQKTSPSSLSHCVDLESSTSVPWFPGSTMCVPWYPEDQARSLKSLCGLEEFHKCTLVPRRHS